MLKAPSRFWFFLDGHYLVHEKIKSGRFFDIGGYQKSFNGQNLLYECQALPPF
jgi:hypothetical protein